MRKIVIGSLVLSGVVAIAAAVVCRRRQQRDWY